MSYGWEGDKVRLVPLDKDRHLENALRWFNDPTITAWLETGDWLYLGARAPREVKETFVFVNAVERPVDSSRSVRSDHNIMIICSKQGVVNYTRP